MKINEDLLPSESYSTSETKLNKTWIDGKPIYRKIITFTSLNNGDSANYVGVIENIDQCVNVYGIVSYGGDKLPIPYNTPEADEWGIGLVVNTSSGKVSIQKGNWGTVSGLSWVIVEYTKTTD